MACHRQDVLQEALFYTFLKLLIALCLCSATGGRVRHLSSCGSTLGITGTSVSGSLWTFRASCHGPQVERFLITLAQFKGRCRNLRYIKCKISLSSLHHVTQTD